MPAESPDARLAESLVLPHGPAWPNRFMLAPLTNKQSHADGTLSDDEIGWLVARAEGGFGLVMTAAAYVDRAGNAWPGQLGISDDAHLPGLSRLAERLRAAGAVSSVQIHHGGMRANAEASGCPLVAPWNDAETGARALTTGEVEGVVEAFAAAAARAERAGFDGVELHGAHGYLLCQFLDGEHNTREDGWGGDYAGRTRIFREVLDAVRASTGADFQVGVRLSPERNGVRTDEMVRLAAELAGRGDVDYLDISLWDVRKTPADAPESPRLLIEDFMEFDRAGVPVGVAGKVHGTADAAWCLEAGADFVVVGKGAIVDRDFAARAVADPAYEAPTPPVSRAHLRDQALGPAFVDYFATGWPAWVSD